MKLEKVKITKKNGQVKIVRMSLDKVIELLKNTPKDYKCIEF